VLDRSFAAPAPNLRWIADFTYVWTAEGWLYVAAVIDLFSRRVVGWSISAAMTAQLVTDALVMAIWRRGRPNALLHHSDRGSQYTSEQFQRLMADHGIVCSMSRSGNVWDNAAMESFFSSLKTERTARKLYRTRDEARADVFDYIERFYNSKRRHSTIGYLSPLGVRKAGWVSLSACQGNRVHANHHSCSCKPKKCFSRDDLGGQTDDRYRIGADNTSPPSQRTDSIGSLLPPWQQLSILAMRNGRSVWSLLNPSLNRRINGQRSMPTMAPTLSERAVHPVDRPTDCVVRYLLGLYRGSEACKSMKPRTYIVRFRDPSLPCFNWRIVCNTAYSVTPV
jgi:hypothetical protein